MLDECLLTEEEIKADPESWADLFTDPFPKWDMPQPA